MSYSCVPKAVMNEPPVVSDCSRSCKIFYRASRRLFAVTTSIRPRRTCTNVCSHDRERVRRAMIVFESLQQTMRVRFFCRNFWKTSPPSPLACDSREVVAWNTAGVASVEAGRVDIASAFEASSARSTAIVSPFFLMLHGLDSSRAAADITSVLDPARSSALRGSTSSDCSTSLVAKMAIRFPLRFILLLNSPLHMDPAVKLFCSKVTVNS